MVNVLIATRNMTHVSNTETQYVVYETDLIQDIEINFHSGRTLTWL